MVRYRAFAVAPSGVSEKSQFRLPTVTGRIAFSAYYPNPFTIGRKNFVLMETDNGAKASAMLYSIVETAKANNLNTYQYLELLLTELPKHAEDKNLQFLDTLLPWSDRVQKECPSKFKKS